jgi:hypothetical protein
MSHASRVRILATSCEARQEVVVSEAVKVVRSSLLEAWRNSGCQDLWVEYRPRRRGEVLDQVEDAVSAASASTGTAGLRDRVLGSHASQSPDGVAVYVGAGVRDATTGSGEAAHRVSRARAAVVRFCLDADALGLAHVVAALRSSPRGRRPASAPAPVLRPQVAPATLTRSTSTVSTHRCTSRGSRTMQATVTTTRGATATVHTYTEPDAGTFVTTHARRAPVPAGGGRRAVRPAVRR